MKVDKGTVYYAVVMNMSGLHDGLYRLKWYDELEGFWDKYRDMGIDLKEIKKITKSSKGRFGLKWLIYDTKAQAQAVRDALETYRDHLKALM